MHIIFSFKYTKPKKLEITNVPVKLDSWNVVYIKTFSIDCFCFGYTYKIKNCSKQVIAQLTPKRRKK